MLKSPSSLRRDLQKSLKEMLRDRSLLSLSLVVFFFCLLMTSRTLSKGWDFEVFWRVSHDFWTLSTSPYDLERYGNMVFKYPPWILPFLLPLGWLPLLVAKAVWGVVQSVSLIFIIVFLDRQFAGQAAARWMQVVLLLVFFGIWGVHGMVGQTSLPMLALALSLSVGSNPVPVHLRAMLSLSAKVLTLFPFLAFLPLRGLAARRFWSGVGLFVVIALILSVPLWIGAYSGTSGGAVALVQDWWHSNFSGTKAVGSIRIGFTTREAQGIPSLFLRVLPLDEGSSRDVLLCVAAGIILVGGYGFWRLRRLKPEVQWLGWLALTPTVQPLAWFHFFSFAYPLLACAWWSELSRTRAAGGEDREQKRTLLSLSVATLLIAALTEKTAGHLGSLLEQASAKSLGVLLAVWVISRIRTK